LSERTPLRNELRFIGCVQAAQVQPKSFLGSASYHRPGQGTQQAFKSIQTAAFSCGRTNGKTVARQLLDRKRTTADLTEHRCVGHFVPVAYGVLNYRPQPQGLILHHCRRPCELAQGRQAIS
jgi:hypothetical protein